jgi:hypothetical protein
MPRKVFTAGEVLAAADVNSFLMDQTIMTFAGTAARGSAIGTATEGMYAHLNDTDTLTYYNGSAWVNRIGATAGILQVVSATKTDAFTTSSTTFTDLTGLSVSITPSSTTSKILVMATISGSSNPAAVAIQIRLMRNSTAIAIGDAAGSRTQVSMAGMAQSTGELLALGVDFLDSPSTTSATTYKIQVRGNTPNTVSVNRAVTDTDSSSIARAVSTITVMEVAG